jgi:hypothetical protein
MLGVPSVIAAVNSGSAFGLQFRIAVLAAGTLDAMTDSIPAHNT